MLLEIDGAILDTPDHRPVLALLNMVADKRHDWFPDLIQAQRTAEFVQGFRRAELRMPLLEKWVEEAAGEASYPRPPDSRRTVGVGVADLAAVVADLEQAAVFLVENLLADGAFFAQVAVALGEDRIVQAIEMKWLRIGHGGGAPQMPELGVAECKKFSIVGPRVALLFDGDRTGPGLPSNNEKGKARAHAFGIRHVHILTFRSAENYVPLVVWEHLYPRQVRKIAKLRLMPPEQRGYQGKDAYPGKILPRQLTVADRNAAEADFHELGSDVVAELRRILAMIHEIL